MHLSERELVSQAIAGHQDALSVLLKKHEPYLRKVLSDRIPQRWQSVLSIEDILQETYIDAFLDVGRLSTKRDEPFRSWLATVAKRNALDAIRMLSAEKRGGRHRRVNVYKGDDSYISLYHMLDRSSGRASRLMAKKEARAKLEDALSILPDQYRQIVVKYDLEGRTSGEIATLLDKSQGAVFMLRARAHRKLKDLLGSSSKFF